MSRKKETRLPALTTLESIKEALDVRLGRRGDPLDRAITLRDLVDAGMPFEAVRLGSMGGGGLGLEYGERPQKLVPKAPEGLVALSVFGGIHILWDSPGSNASRLVAEISRSASSDPATRDVLTYTGGNSFLDMVDSQDETEYFYWVRFLSDSEHYGPYAGPVSAIATPRVSDTLEELTGRIDESHLAESLGTEIERIGRIDIIDTALQTEVDARVADVQAEAAARVSDIQVEAAARVDAILAEQQARAAAINSEQTARLDGDSALAVRVDELSVKIDSLPVFSSGFEDGNDYSQWSAGAASTLVAETSDVFVGTQAARISSTATAPSASGIPGGVIAPIPEGTSTAFAGKRIRVRVHAKQPAAGASAEFSVAYSTNDGDTSGWQAFTPDATWQAFEFLYDVPADGTNTDYLSIWADTSGAGGELLLDAVSVEAVASDIPEFSAAIQTEQQARIDGDQALASELTVLEAEAANNLQAAIAQEQAARASLEEAVATDISSVTARVGSNESEISSIQMAQVEAEMTSALMRSLVAVQDAAASAMVRTEETARIEEDSAIASRVTTVEARIDDDISAAIQNEQTARVSADEALATQIDTVESQLDGGVAAVQQNLNTQVTRLDGRVDSTAQAITTAQSQLGGDVAAVQQNLNTQVTRLDGRVDSTAQAITTAQSQLGSDIASVQTSLTTNVQRVDGELAAMGAQYTAKVQANGLIGGFSVYNDGKEVEAGFDVDHLWVGRTNSNKRKPFIIQGGVTYIDTAMIRDASIQEGKIGPITVGKLKKNDGTPITTAAGLLRADAIDAGNLNVASAATFNGTAKSNNFLAGVRGWRLLQNGNVEFNQGQFNGTVNIGNVSGAGALARKNGLSASEVSGLGGLATKNSLDSLSVPDTRDDNRSPSWYYSNYPKQTVTEFKRASTVGISGEGTFVSLTTKVPWSGSNGGPVVQEVVKKGGVYSREGTSSSWSAWSMADRTADNVAKSIKGQGALATKSELYYSELHGTKPPTNATRNKVFRSSGYPSNPSNGDLWINIGATPNKTMMRVGGRWLNAANLTTNTNQLSDGAKLGEKAVWNSVFGSGKPANGATKNRVYYTNSAPSRASNGDIWAKRDGTNFLRIGGVWRSAGDVTSSKTAYDTARVNGVSASTVENRAYRGAVGSNRVNNWTRPGSTRIDGNKIFTGDAYVDTLEIKGNAIVIPFTAGYWNSSQSYTDTQGWYTVRSITVPGGNVSARNILLAEFAAQFRSGRNLNINSVGVRCFVPRTGATLFFTKISSSASGETHSVDGSNHTTFTPMTTRHESLWIPAGGELLQFQVSVWRAWWSGSKNLHGSFVRLRSLRVSSFLAQR